LSNVLVIVGPTASSKSALSLEIAESIPTEIISADSMQVYKGMDIGTAKINPEKQKSVKHHLIDVASISEPFSAALYQKQAREAIVEVQKKNNLPIIVGGTGLYIRAVIYKLRFPEAPEEQTKKVRKLLEAELAEKGLAYLQEKLMEKDKEAYENTDIDNSRRVVRALEVIEVTGKPYSGYRRDWDNLQFEYPAVLIGLKMPREMLYERINKRVDEMIAKGLLEETARLVELGLKKALVAKQALGYKELIEFNEGKVSFEEAIETIKKRTRQFAKRQLTWFKKDPNIKWYDISETPLKTIAAEAINLLK